MNVAHTPCLTHQTHILLVSAQRRGTLLNCWNICNVIASYFSAIITCVHTLLYKKKIGCSPSMLLTPPDYCINASLHIYNVTHTSRLQTVTSLIHQVTWHLQITNTIIPKSIRLVNCHTTSLPTLSSQIHQVTHSSR